MRIQALIIEQRKVPRNLLKQHTANSRASYQEAGALFLRDMVQDRFTHEHAQEAGYKARKGERMVPGSLQFKRSYTGKKFRKFGHTRPLEFSGETRAGIMVGAAVRPTGQGARITFPGGRKFNFRHPKSQIRMAEEFRTITRTEAATLGQVFERTYTHLANNESAPTIVTRIE